jgi:DNA-directed RNA polymerase omega subunit
MTPTKAYRSSDISIRQLLAHVPNKFLLCVAASRRARQIKDNLHPGVLEEEPIVPVIQALHEIMEGKVKVILKHQPDEEQDMLDKMDQQLTENIAQDEKTEAEKEDKKAKDVKPKHKSKSLAA